MKFSLKHHTGRTRRLGTLATIVLGLAIFAGACGSTQGAAPAAPEGLNNAVASTVYNRTNADRAANGLGGLAWNDQLAGLATEWSQYMADTQQFHHRDLAAVIESPGYEGYASLGENILVGPSAVSGDQMQNAWLASPSHYRNIMGNYDSMGFGLAYGGDGNLRAVVNFGRNF